MNERTNERTNRVLLLEKCSVSGPLDDATKATADVDASMIGEEKKQKESDDEG